MDPIKILDLIDFHIFKGIPNENILYTNITELSSNHTPDFVNTNESIVCSI